MSKMKWISVLSVAALTLGLVPALASADDVRVVTRPAVIQTAVDQPLATVQPVQWGFRYRSGGGGGSRWGFHVGPGYGGGYYGGGYRGGYGGYYGGGYHQPYYGGYHGGYYRPRYYGGYYSYPRYYYPNYGYYNSPYYYYYY